jgi:hypothetical protein
MAPTCFISYSWDSETHKAWVEELARQLRLNGIPTILDQWECVPGDDVPEFMQRSIERADVILVVCTEQLLRKQAKGSGGVWMESAMLSAELFRGAARRVIPLLREGRPDTAIPLYLRGKFHLDFSDDRHTGERLAELLRSLHGGVGRDAPPIGTPAGSPGAPWAAGWLALKPVLFEGFESDGVLTQAGLVHRRRMLSHVPAGWLAECVNGSCQVRPAGAGAGLCRLWVFTPEDAPGSLPTSGAVPASVSVRIEATRHASDALAGIVYARGISPAGGYAFTLSASGEFSVHAFDGEGLRTRYAGRSPGLDPAATHKLGIAGHAGRLDFFVNDALVHSVDEHLDGPVHAGLVAFGSGTFEFDNLAVYEPPPADRSPRLTDAWRSFNRFCGMLESVHRDQYPFKQRCLAGLLATGMVLVVVSAVCLAVSGRASTTPVTVLFFVLVVLGLALLAGGSLLYVQVDRCHRSIAFLVQAAGAGEQYAPRALAELPCYFHEKKRFERDLQTLLS